MVTTNMNSWKIRIDDKENIKILIYDFGFCWRIPDI